MLPLMERAGTLRSLSYNSSDYTGSIMCGNSAELADRIAYNLRSEARQRPVILWNVQKNDPVVRSLYRSKCLIELSRIPIHRIDLGRVRADPEGWLRESATRMQAHRDLKRLQRDGAELTFHWRPDQPGLDVSMNLHDDEWQRRGRKGKFADPHRRRFISSLVKTGFPLFVSKITYNGKVISYVLSFYSRDAVFLWNAGYDIEHRALGPGSALLVAEILELIKKPRIKVFDFLRGDERYKKSYSNQMSCVCIYEITG